MIQRIKDILYYVDDLDPHTPQFIYVWSAIYGVAILVTAVITYL